MALDDHTRDAQTLYAVGINRSLRQPLGIGNLLRLSVEHLHEVPTDNLAFLLWVAHAFQVLEELLTGIYANHVKTQSLISLHHFLELILAQHAVVYEDTSKVATDGLVQ